MKASVANRVKSLLPDTLEVAEKYALQVEAENVLLLESKKNKKDTINNVQETASTNESRTDPALTTILKKLNDFSSAHQSLKDKVNSMFNNESPPNRANTRHQPFRSDRRPQQGYRDNRNRTTPNTRAHPYNRSQNSRRPYYGHCFGCKQTGHRYTDCTTTSAEDIAYIRENFSELLTEYNRQKANAKSSGNYFALPPSNPPSAPLNSNGVTPPQ